MITPDQAWNIILDHVAPLPPVVLKAGEALYHFLAEPVLADRDIPPVDRSAMDGFAVCADDLKQVPVDLAVLGELPAGSDTEFRVRHGLCVRIYTGASLPPGADAVVMQEDTAATEVHNLAGGADKLVASPSHHLASIRILKSVMPGTNIFKRGENARKGDELLAAGRQLDPAGVAVCAAVGRRQVSVYRRPVVNILSSGTELLDEQDDNSHAHPHQVRNSNGPFLRAAVIAQSFNVGGCETIADEPERIATALRHAADKSDVIVISGGVSVGKYDLVPEAIIKAGGMIHYHGIAMKPGKPQLFASLAGRGSSRTGNSLIFGLPGNPLSAMTGFHEFILPALRRLAGCPVAQCRPAMTVRLAQVMEVKGDRHQLAPATLTWNGGGAEAVLVEASGSADLVAGAKADGVLIIPAGPRHIPAGSLMEFRSWRILQ